MQLSSTGQAWVLRVGSSLAGKDPSQSTLALLSCWLCSCQPPDPPRKSHCQPSRCHLQVRLHERSPGLHDVVADSALA